METTTDPAGRLIQPVLTDLADLVAGIPPERFGDATPCAEYDVGALRQHVLGWVTYFGEALNDPDGSGDRPEPATFTAPADPQAAAELVRSAATRIGQAVEAGVAQQSVLVVKAKMPGEMVLRMALWEYVTHGSDLAKAVGRPWDPPAAAVADALDFAPKMLSDEYRGAGKDFGPEVPVADDAPPLHQLLGFSGRDPHWS